MLDHQIYDVGYCARSLSNALSFMMQVTDGERLPLAVKKLRSCDLYPQKYRLYLKSLSAVANQQANMVAALRGRDPSSYLPMGSLDGYPNFNALVGNRPLPASQSFQPNGALPRMNNLTGFGIHGFFPSRSGQLGRTSTTSGN